MTRGMSLKGHVICIPSREIRLGMYKLMVNLIETYMSQKKNISHFIQCKYQKHYLMEL